MNPTIKDIAKLVGVSPSTVSRALNGSSLISPETSARIRKAMEELNYHPNSIAKSFATGNTGIIALIIDADREEDFANNFFNRSMFAMEKTAREAGYNFLILSGAKDRSAVDALVYEKKADGVIIPSSCLDISLLGVLEQEQFPCVILGEPSIVRDSATWVDIDNEQGGYLAVQHLADHGYRHIVLVLDHTTTVFARRREEGVRRAAESMPSLRGTVMVAGTGGELERGVREVLRKEGADAFVCSNNEMAYQVLHYLREMGKRVPEDVGVVAFDNYPLAEYMDPPLTAVDIDTYALGRRAAEELLRRIRSRDIEPSHIRLDVRVLERKSSAREETRVR